MSRTAANETDITDVRPSETPKRTKEKPVTSSSKTSNASSDSRKSTGLFANFSESAFFPVSSDAIWQSADRTDGASSSCSEENYTNPLEVQVSEGEGNVEENIQLATFNENVFTGEPTSSSMKEPEPLLIPRLETPADRNDQLPNGSDQLVMTTDSSTNQEDVVTPAADNETMVSPCNQERSVAIPVVERQMRGKKGSLQLHRQLLHLAPPSPGADVQELEQKLESGLRFLDDLVHAQSSDNGELKDIYEAYYDFADALFKDIKDPSREKICSKNGSESSDMGYTRLEQKKDEIAKQQMLLKKEIIHYKTTKRELEKIAGQIEETSKSYRKPEILEDVDIPQDIRLSSSSEYVAEIEELQEEILRKQETLKEMRREIQQHLLPKSLVDSVCESHRLAMQDLRDIEEETAYLKECIGRLDLKYLYSLQTS